MFAASLALYSIIFLNQDREVKLLSGSERPSLEIYKSYEFCHSTGFGYIFTHSQEFGQKYANEIYRAAKTYEKHFGITIKPGIVAEVAYGEPTPMPNDFASANISWVFPVVNDPRSPYPLAHELGHTWYDIFQWQQLRHEPDTVRPYGTPASDYLDEIAGILMEPEAEKEKRRRFIYDEVQIVEQAQKHWSLRSLVTLKHPNSTEQRDDFQIVIRFYSMCLALSDYLIETTKNEKIWAIITEAEKKKIPFEKWLTSSGQKYNLPLDVSILDKNWREWLKRKATSGHVLSNN